MKENESENRYHISIPSFPQRTLVSEVRAASPSSAGWRPGAGLVCCSVSKLVIQERGHSPSLELKLGKTMVGPLVTAGVRMRQAIRPEPDPHRWRGRGSWPAAPTVLTAQETGPALKWRCLGHVSWLD